jgi:hypothetical protein
VKREQRRVEATVQQRAKTKNGPIF